MRVIPYSITRAAEIGGIEKKNYSPKVVPAAVVYNLQARR
jgi:hypothetical protein